MYTNDLNPVFLSMGPVELRYYGLVYFLGFLLAWIYLKKSAMGKKTFKNKEHADDFIFYIMLSSILSARLFYIIFYNLQFYSSNPLEIFKFWHGGMSVHGGIFGAILGTFWFIRKYKESKYKILQLSDMMAIPLAIGLAFGRIANFINGELYGRITSLPWGVKFKSAEGFRHPSQLYESLKNFLIVFLLTLKSKKPFRQGELSALFLIYYAILRFLIEFVREPEISFGIFTMGQVLSIPMFILGVWMYRKI